MFCAPSRRFFYFGNIFMITIKNLTFTYHTKPIIKDLNLTLPSGFSLLIGPTGCGKSTLLKLIANLYPKYAGKILSGNIDLHHQKTAMMFQNAGEQFTMPTPREEIVFALENLQFSNTEYKKRLAMAVDFTQIDHLLDQKISTMSGGEKQRVALAVLIAMDVDILILDEPFASCDPESRQFLINKLNQLRTHGKTILISDHVLSGYQEICDQVYKLEQNKVKKLSQTEVNQLFTQKKNTSHTFSLPKSNEEAIFEFNNVQISQNRLLLDQAHLKIFVNKVTLLTGTNGVGKSSLFKALSKMIPYTGSIHYRKHEVQKLNSRKYLRQVGQIFQNADEQFLKVTVQEEVELAKKNLPKKYFSSQRIDYWLKYLELDSHLGQVVYTLSGGQKKKLQILLMLMSSQEVLLIDEPLSGLDSNSIKKVIHLMKECQKELGQTILIISHQVDEIASWCDYHLEFKDKQLTYLER